MRFAQTMPARRPMLPVVAPPATVARQHPRLFWRWPVTTVVLWRVADLGWLYGTFAILAGGWFLAEAHRLYRLAKRDASGAELRSMRLFHGSITYLTIVFAAVAIDVLLLS